MGERRLMHWDDVSYHLKGLGYHNFAHGLDIRLCFMLINILNILECYEFHSYLHLVNTVIK